MNQTNPLSSFRRWSLFFCLAALAGFLSPLQAQKVLSADFSEGAIESLEESVAFILTLSEEELRARVPVESGGIWFTDCPNCDFGTQDRGRFSWTPEKPHQIQCEGCGEVYPNNPKYPDNKYIEVDAPAGVHRFAYWEHPETGYRIFFRAHADYLHRGYLETAVRNLGRLYAATGDERYARPAAILLHRFAEVVPGYAYIFDFPYQQKRFSPYTNDRIPGTQLYRTSLWTFWAYNDIPRKLLEGYDFLHDWAGWEDIAGPDTRQTIEKDLFTLITRFVLSFEDPLTNMSPRIWHDAIYAGRVLDRPEWVHESIRRFEKLLNQQFLHDGHWFETSPSYHAMTINGMRSVMEAAEGYSDPAGYRDPQTGRRFDNLSLEKDVPPYGLAIRALRETRLPSGRLLPVNDTWAVHTKAASEMLPPRDASESLLMPGLGVAILGAGAGENQVFSWLNFSSGTAHKHRDTLSIGLFGHGEEVLSDIGYSHTRYRRAWASSMMSHNTVVVDGREAAFDEEYSGNRPVAFATDGKEFQLAAAESEAAYPGRAERYRRTLILLGDKAADAYLLDVFEIIGGNQHDYLLHGSSDAESRASIGGTDLRPFRGTLVNAGITFKEPAGEHDDMGPGGSFSFIRELTVGPADRPLWIDFRLEDKPDLGSRTVVAPLPEMEIYLGRSPSIRQADESDGRLDDHHRPSVVLRRRGENLNTVFVAAHEAVNGYPRLQDIKLRRDGERLWISVTHAGGRDYISLSSDNPAPASLDTAKGTFTTDAAYAVVRLDRNDDIRTAHLVEGKELQFRKYRLEGPGVFSGNVRRLNTGEPGQTFFDLDKNLTVKKPDLLIVEFPDGLRRGYTVERVEKTTAGSRIHVREGAGFVVEQDHIALTSYPQRPLEGGTRLTYRLIDSAHSD